eukprot:CAMPEP_0194410038 /NCGR_PEP_ID=MMETSP0176-20130528/8018_1 /TAXON_ID=216777 /ORGANISM="Proboscia alata, Strain PI-D3" /LENGTH=40 /DNA_ID= /DNA_START= /DNA_END= /DNA_ORIENTATION=
MIDNTGDGIDAKDVGGVGGYGVNLAIPTQRSTVVEPSAGQ